MATVNFVTDFSAPTDGVTNASSAVDAWLTYGAANDGSTLVMPAHAYHFAGTNTLSAGIKNCTISATGASVDALYIGNSNLISPDFSHSARLQTANAGDTSVTIIAAGGSLTAPADATLFSVGRWIYVTGLAIQTPDAYPPSFEFGEYRQIAGIAGSVLSFADPLVFSYKSTWPFVDASVATINIATSVLSTGHSLVEGQKSFLTTNGALPTGVAESVTYFAKNVSGQTCQLSLTSGGAAISLSGSQSGTHYYHANPAGDLGGPATVYALSALFDGTQTYTGLRVTQSGGVNVGAGKNLTLDGMTFDGNGPSVSVGKSITLRNCDPGDIAEIDKGVENLTYDNCRPTGINKQLALQSASVVNLIIKNGSVFSTLNGTAYNTDIQDTSEVDLIIAGATGFGRSNSLTVSSSATIGASSRTATHFIALTDVSFSGGTFTIANSGNFYDAVRLFVPGFKYAIGYTISNQINIADNNGGAWSFKVLDVTQDANNFYVSTTLSALPTGVTFAGQAANAIFAYGVRSLSAGGHALSAIAAFVEPSGVVPLRFRIHA